MIHIHPNKSSAQDSHHVLRHTLTISDPGSDRHHPKDEIRGCDEEREICQKREYRRKQRPQRAWDLKESLRYIERERIERERGSTIIQSREEREILKNSSKEIRSNNSPSLSQFRSNLSPRDVRNCSKNDSRE